ncbi:MAG: lipopolysaccharide biosynthesis protein [Bacteroidia bacterium]
MKVFKALATDSLVYGASNFLNKIVGFLLLPLYTSYLSPYDYGIVAMLAYVQIFFLPLSSLGITNAIFRRFNLLADENEQNKVLSTGVFGVIISALFFFLLAFYFQRPLTVFLIDDVSLVFLMQLSLYTALFRAVSSIFLVVLRAERQVLKIGILKIVELIISLCLTILFVVYFDKGVVGVIVGNLGGAIFSFLMTVGFCYTKIRLSFSLSEVKELLSYGLPYLPHRMLSYGSAFFGHYLIKIHVGLEASGLFDIALKFAIPLTFIVGSVQSAWVPLKFQIHREEENPSLVFRSVISNYLAFVLGLYILLSLIGPEFVRVFTTKPFHEAAYYLPIVLLIPLSRSVYFMLATGFEFDNNSKPLPLISAVGLMSLLIVSLPLMSVFGSYGAIFGIVASWGVMATIIRLYAIKRFYVPLNINSLKFFIICTLVVCFASYSVQGIEAFYTRLLAISSILFFGFVVFRAIIKLYFNIETSYLAQLPLYAKIIRVFNIK